MTFFDAEKSLVENIYLLSGPVIAILGFVAILQLKLTKKTLQITSKRQAAELATRQVEIYTNEIIIQQNQIDEFEKTNGIKRIDIDCKLFTQDELFNLMSNENISKRRDDFLKNVNSIVTMLNSMETFSLYFTKGIADEEIAYSAIGVTFCETVKHYSFELSASRYEAEENVYYNIIKLYDIWNSRIQSENLNKEILIKQNEFKQLSKKKIDIIGTK